MKTRWNCLVLVALHYYVQPSQPQKIVTVRSVLHHPQQSIKYAVLYSFSKALRERGVSDVFDVLPHPWTVCSCCGLRTLPASPLSLPSTYSFNPASQRIQQAAVPSRQNRKTPEVMLADSVYSFNTYTQNTDRLNLDVFSMSCEVSERNCEGGVGVAWSIMMVFRLAGYCCGEIRKQWTL